MTLSQHLNNCYHAHHGRFRGADPVAAFRQAMVADATLRTEAATKLSQINAVFAVRDPGGCYIERIFRDILTSALEDQPA